STVSFWQHGLLKDVMIVRNEIIFSGPDTIYRPVIALALDGDVNRPEDDRLKGVQNESTRAAIFFTNASASDPLLGVLLLNGQHGANRVNMGMTSLRYWDIGDDPLTDS